MQSKLYSLVIVTCLLLLAGTSSASSDINEVISKRNLFVGNSFSYYNNGIQNHYSNLIRTSGEWRRGKNYNRLSTLSGGSLLEHQADLRSILTAARNKYQSVILQGHSMEAIDPKRVASFKQGVKALATIADEQNAKPILFMTWGYKGNQDMGKKVARAYTEIGKQLSIDVVPVGLAFAKVEADFPDIALFSADVSGANDAGQLTYRKDWKHPSVAGTYLAACVFYAAVENKSPQGSVYRASLNNKTAHILQQVAWQVVQDFKRK